MDGFVIIPGHSAQKGFWYIDSILGWLVYCHSIFGTHPPSAREPLARLGRQRLALPGWRAASSPASEGNLMKLRNVKPRASLQGYIPGEIPASFCFPGRSLHYTEMALPRRRAKTGLACTFSPFTAYLCRRRFDCTSWAVCSSQLPHVIDCLRARLHKLLKTGVTPQSEALDESKAHSRHRTGRVRLLLKSMASEVSRWC
jgi:hypothetical protein